MTGILIIDKQVGFTSHDVVARVRRLLKEKRVGHTGTLDPFATGVLVVLVGKATRLAQFLNNAVKEYEGTIRFGYATETGDATGVVRIDTRVQTPSIEFARLWDAAIIEEALAGLRGQIEQVPPMYSAKKVSGKKLYEFARKGEEIERQAVSVTVHEFEVMQTDGVSIRHNPDGTCDLNVRVVCSTGTYIRTLAEALGDRLGVAAHLLTLRRTRAGDFQINDAHTLEELEDLAGSGSGVAGLLVPLRSALRAMATTLLSDDAVRQTRHGAAIHSIDGWLDGQLVQMCDDAGELIAIGAYDLQLQCLRPRIVLSGAD